MADATRLLARKQSLEPEKGDRSFSEVIREYLEDRRQLADVTGAGVLDREIHDEVIADIEALSRAALSPPDDETL
ncbi:hypothetical protein [Halalkaliarchaeum desulfuricum]|uniref:hypothetical protein n=1 Tax=Halalkaliarchaeum desulfuricum TaxID=2055893 RepID=UPI000E6B83FD